MVVSAAASYFEEEALQPLKSPGRDIHEHKTGQTIDHHSRRAQGYKHPGQTDASGSEYHILAVHRQSVKRQRTSDQKGNREGKTADRRQRIAQQAYGCEQIEMVAENQTREPEQLVRKQDKRGHHERQDKRRPEFTKKIAIE